MKGILDKNMAKKHKPSKAGSPAVVSRRKQKARKRKIPWLWIILGTAALFFLVAVLIQKPATSQGSEIPAVQAYEKYQQGAFFLDVRSQAEWNQVHIARSTLIPLDELQSRLVEIPRDQDVVVVCLSGKRSKEGMTILQQAGFSRASCLTGGLTAWKAAGYPLEGTNP